MAENKAQTRPAGGPPAGNKMGTAPIPGLLFKMALPAICSMMVQAIYNVVDSIFVSQISEDALAAVTLVFPVQMLLVAVGVGTGIGINSLIARRLGQKNFEDANSAATHGFFLAFCSWVVFFLAGLFLSRPFYSWYSDDPGLVDMAVSYGSIVLCVSIFMMFQCICEKILQGTGNMVLPMVSHIIGCVVNIILDPIMIFGYLGLPAMGVAGAAWATVIGQGCGMLVVLVFVLKKQKEVHIQLKGFRPSGRVIKDIYTVALPGMIMQAIPSFVNIFLNMILISFSTTAVTVLGVYFKLQSFVFMPTFGLGQGALPIMGYNYGARNRERLIQTLKLALGSAIVIMVIGLILFQTLPHVFMGFFEAEGEMLRMGIQALRTLSLCFIPAAVGISFSNLFQALGYGTYSLITTLCRQLFTILPLSFFLSKIYAERGVWMAYPLAEIVSLTVCTILFIRLYRKEIATIPKKDHI